MSKKRTISKKFDKLKIYTLGNSSVGKTCFILRFTEEYFSETYIKTTWIDMKT